MRQQHAPHVCSRVLVLGLETRTTYVTSASQTTWQSRCFGVSTFRSLTLALSVRFVYILLPPPARDATC